jgi:hypothetical protein
VRKVPFTIVCKVYRSPFHFDQFRFGGYGHPARRFFGNSFTPPSVSSAASFQDAPDSISPTER